MSLRNPSFMAKGSIRSPEGEECGGKGNEERTGKWRGKQGDGLCVLQIP